MNKSTFQKLLKKAKFNIYPTVYIVQDNGNAINMFYSNNEAISFRNVYFSNKDIFFTWKKNTANIEVINQNNLINYY